MLKTAIELSKTATRDEMKEWYESLTEEQKVIFNQELDQVIAKITDVWPPFESSVKEASNLVVDFAHKIGKAFEQNRQRV